MINDMHTNCPPPMPFPSNNKKPLQLKRGTARAFAKVNPILLEGQPAFETDSNRLKIGNGKSRYLDLPYIGEGDGKSAYEIWLDEGHKGSVEDFLNSLVGPAGKSTYEIWLSLGNEGTIADFINSLTGATGKSAFEWWRDEYMKDPSLTEIDYINNLRTYSWADFEIESIEE